MYFQVLSDEKYLLSSYIYKKDPKRITFKYFFLFKTKITIC